MRMINVESSNIESVGYESGSLFVKYQSGKTYKYDEVPEDLFYNILGARSKGKMINESVKPNYKYSCVS